jgi:hypothetical protein
MEAHETIRCRGHPLVLGTHPTTFEITAEDHLTETGNCIIAVAADKGCAGLSGEFRDVLAHDDAVLVTTLSCGGITAVIRSRGSSKFTLDHPSDMVWRRSSFVCGRTIGILADHVAVTLPEELIRCLAHGTRMTATLCVTRPG